MNTIEIKISTPDSEIANLTCSSVTLPAYDGEMMVLPAHESMVILLRKGGTVRIAPSTAEPILAFLLEGGGIANIKGDSCTIISQSCCLITEDAARSTAQKAM